MLSHAAMFYKKRVAYSWREYNSLLGTDVRDLDLLAHGFSGGQNSTGLISLIEPGEPYNLINTQAFYADIPISAKVSYIELAASITNDQRWNYKLWNKPILIPHYEQDIHPGIPQSWLTKMGKFIRMNLEENYYG